MTVTDLAAYAMAVAFTLAVATWTLGVLLRLVLDGHALATAARLTAGWLLGLDLDPSDDDPDPAPVATDDRRRTTVTWEWRAGDGSGTT